MYVNEVLETQCVDVNIHLLAVNSAKEIISRFRTVVCIYKNRKIGLAANNVHTNISIHAI